METSVEESTPQTSVGLSVVQHSGPTQPFQFPTIANPTHQPDGRASVHTRLSTSISATTSTPTSRLVSVPAVGERGYYHGYPHGRPVLTREDMRMHSTRRLRSGRQ